MSDHPLNKLRQRGGGKDISEVSLLSNNMLGRKVKVFGLVSKTRKIMTKSGEPMMFLSLGDSVKEVDTVIFPKTLASLEKKACNNIQNNQIVVMEGKLEIRNDNMQIICDNLYKIEES